MKTQEMKALVFLPTFWATASTSFSEAVKRRENKYIPEHGGGKKFCRRPLRRFPDRMRGASLFSLSSFPPVCLSARGKHVSKHQAKKHTHTLRKGENQSPKVKLERNRGNGKVGKEVEEKRKER